MQTASTGNSLHHYHLHIEKMFKQSEYASYALTLSYLGSFIFTPGHFKLKDITRKIHYREKTELSSEKHLLLSI